MKFTKVAALIMSLSIVGASVAACSNEPEPVSSDVNVISTQNQNSGAGTDATSDDKAASENYVFTYKGVNFIINTDIDVSSFADSDYDLDQVASCAGQGLASQYSFGSTFFVETDVGSDVIVWIKLFDDTVSTAEGVYIGQTVEDVKAVYGEPSTSTDYLMVYTKGTSELRFEVADGKVTSINYMRAGIK